MKSIMVLFDSLNPACINELLNLHVYTCTQYVIRIWYYTCTCLQNNYDKYYIQGSIKKIRRLLP